jgi:hypothetical protein
LRRRLRHGDLDQSVRMAMKPTKMNHLTTVSHCHASPNRVATTNTTTKDPGFQREKTSMTLGRKEKHDETYN